MELAMLRAIRSLTSLNASMSTLQEIKTAIGRLDPSKQAILTAELFAMASDPEEKELEAALERDCVMRKRAVRGRLKK
jgi:hypothetical protein